MSLSANRAGNGKYSSPQQVRAAALIYLGRRPYAKRELKEKLLQKGAKEEHVEAALDTLVRDGLLDEAKLVEAFIHTRKEISLKGPSYLYRELLAKGVDKEKIIYGLERYYDEEEEKIIIKRLIEKEARYLKAGADAATERVFWHKLALKLQNRGFASGAVLAAIDEQKRMLLDKNQD